MTVTGKGRLDGPQSFFEGWFSRSTSDLDRALPLPSPLGTEIADEQPETITWRRLALEAASDASPSSSSISWWRCTCGAAAADGPAQGPRGFFGSAASGKMSTSSEGSAR